MVAQLEAASVLSKTEAVSDKPRPSSSGSEPRLRKGTHRRITWTFKFKLKDHSSLGSFYKIRQASAKSAAVEPDDTGTDVLLTVNVLGSV